MPRSPSVSAPDRSSSQSVFDRLQQMHDLGEVDLVHDGGTVITQAQTTSFGARIQTLSDRISTLEATLADQSNMQTSGKDADLTGLLRDLNATRRELTGLCNVLLGAEE